MEERTSARSKGTNRVEVPEARGALDRFKFEVANEIGVDLKEGYNGHLTTAQAGSVGGEMVRKMIRRHLIMLAFCYIHLFHSIRVKLGIKHTR